MADDKDILRALLKALQEKSDDSEDKDLKTLFKEVRDELRIMNGNTKEDQALTRKQREYDEFAKTYSGLRSRTRPGSVA